MSKELLISKLAQNLSDSELLDLAMAKLSDSDIAELEKEANAVTDQLGRIAGGVKGAITGGGSSALQGVKNLGGAALNAAEHVVNPTIGTFKAMGADPRNMAASDAGVGVMGRAGQALGHMAGAAKANPGTAAVGGVAGLAGLYMLAQKMGLIGQPNEGSHGDMSADGSCGGAKMASDLDKLAQDPAVVLAMHILAQNGLL